jgi:two-component system, LytTR family, sensor kinase
MNKEKIYWICQIGGWSLYSLINIFFLVLADKIEVNHFFGLFTLSGFFILSSHYYRNFIIKWQWLKLTLSSLIPRVLAAVAVLGVFNYIFQIITYYPLGIIDIEKDFRLILILVNAFSMMLLYFLWSLIYFLYHYVESYNTSLKLEAAYNEIELNNLKSQLNPHFIFNALNSIRALVNEDPEKAKRAITQLSNILRSSLVMDKKRLVRFSDEMKTVKDYLDLEKIRFEERLTIEYFFDPATENFEIPPLMMQTLVENGIKHGISTLKQGGVINITTKVKDLNLHIYIRNSGKFVENAENGTGYGIQNTIKRLKLIFGDSASFSIKNLSETEVLTEIIIPHKNLVLEKATS